MPEAPEAAAPVLCSRCGRDLPGPAGPGPGDLDQPARALTCGDCLRMAALGPPEEPGPGVAAVEESLGGVVTLVQAEAAEPVGAQPSEERLGRLEGRLDALEAQAREAADGLLRAVEAQRLELRATLDEHAHRFEAALQHEAEREGGDVGEIAIGFEALARAQVEMSGRLDSLARRFERAGEADAARPPAPDERLDRLAGAHAELARAHQALDERVGQLQAGLEAEAGSARRDPAALERAADELSRVEDRLNRRIDGLAEQGGRAPGPDDQRLRTLERRVEEALGRLVGTVGLAQGLAELRSTVSELGQLQGDLDTGLGELRSEIDALREAHEALAADPAGRDGPSPPSGATEAATEELRLEHQQLKAQLAELERATAAATSAARGSWHDSALAPLRSDVTALRKQLAAQREALAAVSKSVEVLGKRSPATPSASARTRRGHQ